ncbi:M56 family metallopeptidase [Glaciecola sp. MF2-115]|uniref:M56 family metallopeptidase n=1 Tax=Glaciecola sp. MF2-115 TaxID=3384827 RepID=UPI0039A1026C
MIEYFTINVCISMLVIAIVYSAKARVTLNYILSAIALLCWIVPFSLISNAIPNTISNSILLSATPMIVSNQVMQEIHLAELQIPWFSNLFWLFSVIGLANFCRIIYRHYIFTKALQGHNSTRFLKPESEKHGIPVFRTDIPQAGFLLGVFSPKVFVAQSLSDDELCELVIQHEKCHAKNHDNLKLFVTRFIQCVFWFNPFVRKLAAINQLYIEAKCDRKTSEITGVNEYSALFAKLMLKNSYQQSHLVSPAVTTGNQNIQRLQLLQEKSAMTTVKRTLISLILAFGFALVSASVIAMSLNSNLMRESTQKVSDKANGEIGTLVEVIYNIRTALSEDTENNLSGKLSYWASFGETFIHDTTFGHILKITVEDEGEMARVTVVLIEENQGTELAVAKPTLNTGFDQYFYIEIDNREVSESGYSIKLKPVKTEKPIPQP